MGLSAWRPGKTMLISLSLGTVIATATWAAFPAGAAAAGSRTLIAPDGSVVVATDLGVFVDNTKTDGLGHWKRLGLSAVTATGNLPTASAVYLTPSPDGKTLYVATHGRGIWSAPMP